MIVSGIASSPGMACAKAYLLENFDVHSIKYSVEADKELSRLDDIIKKVETDLKNDQLSAKIHLEEKLLAVFDAHLLILKDPEFQNAAKSIIMIEAVNLEYAVNEVLNSFIKAFAVLPDTYFQERIADIKDVKRRILAKSLGIEMKDVSQINEEVIIVAHDLAPTDTAKLNKQFVKGFITEIGGRTSHSVIMARSMEIPAITGIKSGIKTIKSGDLLLLNGTDGTVTVNPDESEKNQFHAAIKSYEEKQMELKTLRTETSETKDHYRVEIAANIGSITDIKGAKENGADGIGLFRTEFLYMDRDDLPSEEEQYQAYKAVLEAMQNKPVVIRTLDIGGDKKLSYLKINEEMNPFLGYRAIRICLKEEELFKNQLKALLRASVFGNLKIMFPMIATLDEFKKAISMLKEVKQELIQNGIVISDKIEVGMMVEIPAAVMLAEEFAKEVDFFSIGTNDLIQYTFAADRMNESVAYLYQPLNPAILRMIKHVIECAHKEGKWVGLCGEMAGDKTALPILLSFGLDEFSMSVSSILPARKLLRSLEFQKVQSAFAGIECHRDSEAVKMAVESCFENL